MNEMGNTMVFGYFFQAGLVVKSVMLMLLSASIFSWAIIIQRTLFFKKQEADYEQFNQRFWESPTLAPLYELVRRQDERGGLAGIFRVGFGEFLRMRNVKQVNLKRLDRIIDMEQTKANEALEQHLPLFASIGSISPFVGLFGTVWGIMTSFQALGQASQATIAMVAPGISEALVATALGLFTAIPAVIAYNRFAAKANFLGQRYALFQEELMTLIAEQMETPVKEQTYETSI